MKINSTAATCVSTSVPLACVVAAATGVHHFRADDQGAGGSWRGAAFGVPHASEAARGAASVRAAALPPTARCAGRAPRHTCTQGRSCRASLPHLAAHRVCSCAACGWLAVAPASYPLQHATHSLRMWPPCRVRRPAAADGCLPARHRPQDCRRQGQGFFDIFWALQRGAAGRGHRVLAVWLGPGLHGSA